jgi:hypothetical protein
MRDLCQLISSQPFLRQDVRAVETLLGCGLAIELFLNPASDQRRIGARLKSGPMPGELSITLGDLAARRGERLSLRRDQVLCGRQNVEGPVEVVGSEQPAEPAVQSRDDTVLS